LTASIVGILVNNYMFRGIRRGRTFHENISFYEEGARQYGVVPVYFRLQDINLQNESVKALTLRNGGYEVRTLALPKVIHNRALYFRNRKANAKLERLVSQKGRFVFNRWNRYGKWLVHNLLNENQELRPHLPETAKATIKNMKRLCAKHSAVIVKPSNSSIGKGIMKLNQSGKGWQLTYPSQKKRGKMIWRTVRFQRRAPSALTGPIRRKFHIAQQRLELATYKGNPFDMRVSVQRNETGAFAVTGIAAKVAKRNAFVTNVAQGGSVFRFEDVLAEYPHLYPPAVRQSVEMFAVSAANYLSEKLPSLSDIGFDIGITKDGFPVFIEMNLRDLRYSFQEGGMMEEWKRTYANPMGYAKYLLDRNAPN
jgi:hypothetical protein